MDYTRVLAADPGFSDSMPDKWHSSEASILIDMSQLFWGGSNPQVTGDLPYQGLSPSMPKRFSTICR